MMDKFLCESHLALIFHQLRLQDLPIQVECQTGKKRILETQIWTTKHQRCLHCIENQVGQGESQNLSSLHAGHFSGWDPAGIDPRKKSESWKAKVEPGRRISSFGGVGNIMRVFTVEKSQTNATTQWIKV